MTVASSRASDPAVTSMAPPWPTAPGFPPPPLPPAVPLSPLPPYPVPGDPLAPFDPRVPAAPTAPRTTPSSTVMPPRVRVPPDTLNSRRLDTPEYTTEFPLASMSTVWDGMVTVAAKVRAEHDTSYVMVPPAAMSAWRW